MSDSFKIQQNVKVGQDLINLRADSPQEFEGIANWVVENAHLLVNVQTALNGVPPALAGNVTKTEVHNEAPPQAPQQDNSGWGAPGNVAGSSPSQQSASPSFANPAQPQLAGGGSETDKWGNVWEYGRPDAPATPRGPAVLKRATSQAGKPYAKWEDPAAGPRWFTERQPKVDPSQRWQGQFARGV